MDAASLLEPQLEDASRRSLFLIKATQLAIHLAKLAPTYLANWMLWVAWSHPDIDEKVVEIPFAIAEDFITGATDRAEIGKQLDRCSYPLADLLAGKKITPSERALAVAAVIGLMCAETSSPQTIGSLAVGCIFDVDESSERWASCLVNLQRHVELAQASRACQRCAVEGCNGWAVGVRYCRAHNDACAIDRFSALERGEAVSFSLADALAFERIAELSPELAAALQRDVAARAR